MRIPRPGDSFRVIPAENQSLDYALLGTGWLVIGEVVVDCSYRENCHFKEEGCLQVTITKTGSAKNPLWDAECPICLLPSKIEIKYLTELDDVITNVNDKEDVIIWNGEKVKRDNRAQYSSDIEDIILD